MSGDEWDSYESADDWWAEDSSDSAPEFVMRATSDGPVVTPVRAEHTMAEWRAFWRAREEISAELVRECGVDNTLVLTRNHPEKGVLEVDGDEIVLLVMVLDEDGRKQLARKNEADPKSVDIVHRERRFKASPERLARYRADLDAVVL